MPLPIRAAALVRFAPLIGVMLCAAPAPSAAQNPTTLPSETPDTVHAGNRAASTMCGAR